MSNNQNFIPNNQYFDESKEGAKKYGEGVAFSRTLEGLWEKLDREKEKRETK